MQIMFDSSILIDHIRGITSAKELIRKVKTGEVKGVISSITEAEILAGRECKSVTKRNTILELIGIFQKFVVDNEISQKAAEFRRNYNLPLIDCIIAATAFVQDSELWTKNIEHFKKIREIKSEEPY